jgi:conjugative transfer signal peptidase TraF
MAEARSLPAVRWGEELRRRRLRRRRQRLRLAGAAAIAAVAVAVLLTLFWPPRPVLLWNVSSSAPVGLYAVGAPSRIRVGDMVVAWAPPAARELAAERGYLPARVPLLKKVAAGTGDRVCAVGEALFVNGRFEARRRLWDKAGRPLPGWTGCEDLGAGEYLLLMPSPDSFDGRYFGVTAQADLAGRTRLLWAH